MSEQEKCPQCGAKMREFIQCTEDGSVYHDHAIDGCECLRRHLAQAQAENERLKAVMNDLLGVFAAVGVCEPVEGFVKLPGELTRCVKNLVAAKEKAEAACAAFRQGCIDLTNRWPKVVEEDDRVWLKIGDVGVVLANGYGWNAMRVESMRTALASLLGPLVRDNPGQPILDELAKLREENATLKAERDAVYALAKGPAEQAKHIPLHQWVSTRFVHVEDHNDAINQLRASRDSAVAAEREKAEKAESTIQDMQCTYEFGSRVMNTLIIPNASNMLKDESALSALTRWLNCAIERAEQKGDEMVAMKQAHADDMERLASDMAISRGNAVLAERERCEQYITSSIEEHREAGELNLVDELVAIAAAIRQGGEGAK